MNIYQKRLVAKIMIIGTTLVVVGLGAKFLDEHDGINDVTSKPIVDFNIRSGIGVGFDLTSIRYAANRADDVVKFSDDALEMIAGVPRPFLKLVLNGCVKWAKENNCTLITSKEMKEINDKRSKDKKK